MELQKKIPTDLTFLFLVKTYFSNTKAKNDYIRSGKMLTDMQIYIQ